MWMGVAEEKDFPEIIELANWSYRGREGAPMSWNLEAGILEGQRMDESLLRDDLASKSGGALLLFRETPGDVLLGTAWVHPLEGHLWHLSLLTVRPDQQDRGLGGQFLEAAERYVREHGGRRMQISVLHVRNGLLAWYDRRGYRLTGETEPFPYGDHRFGRPLRDDLHFVILERPL